MGRGHITVKTGMLQTLKIATRQIYIDFIAEGKLLGFDKQTHLTKYYLEHPDFIGISTDDDYVFEFNYNTVVTLSKLKRWDNVDCRYRVVKVYNGS